MFFECMFTKMLRRKHQGKIVIPNYQQFMQPFLEIAQAANGNEVKLRDVINELADKFNLTEMDKAETLPSGKQSILDNRVGWARTYLTKAGLLEVTRRAHFIITERGTKALQDAFFGIFDGTTEVPDNWLDPVK